MSSYSMCPNVFVYIIVHALVFASWLRCDRFQHYQLFCCLKHDTSIQTLLGELPITL